MSTQLDIFGSPPRARLTDPAPSHAAAHKAAAFAGTHSEKIVGFLARIFPGAADPEQIANATGLTVVQVDRRRKELLTAGRIVVVGTGTMSNGNDAGRWRLAGEPERRAA